MKELKPGKLFRETVKFCRVAQILIYSFWKFKRINSLSPVEGYTVVYGGYAPLFECKYHIPYAFYFNVKQKFILKGTEMRSTLRATAY